MGSKKLVDLAVERWRVCKLRADNTSAVVVMLDPPGPPRAQVLRRQRDAAKNLGHPRKQACNNQDAPPLPPKPKSVLAPVPVASSTNKGLAIISRFPNSKKPEEASGKNLVTGKEEQLGGRIVHDNIKTEPTKVVAVEKPSGSRPPSKPMVKRKRGEVEGRAGGGQAAKRERTTTWAGRTLRQPKSEKVTRSSKKTAAPPLAPPIKGRRSLNILAKK